MRGDIDGVYEPMYINKVNFDRLALGISLLEKGKLKEDERDILQEFLLDLLINRLEVDSDYVKDRIEVE